jgi:N6-adenosine-specific RNA methylase IME4
VIDLFNPWPFGDLPQRSARVVLADPPWAFMNYSKKGEKKNPNQHYQCMSLADIQALPVRDLAHPGGAVCIMWATAPLLPEAVATMGAWGFTFKSAGAWAKQSKTGQKWAFGPGYVFRSAAEFYLLGSIGKPEYRSHSIRNLIVAPAREHSRKPDEMRANIEKQFAPPYVELFARESAPGWSVWGNQTDKFSTQGD